jgi:hypothetical protein
LATDGTPQTKTARFITLRSAFPTIETGGWKTIACHISQLWLSPGNTTATNTLAAVGVLESNAKAAGIGQIFYQTSLETMFNAPGVPTVNGPAAICCRAAIHVVPTLSWLRM